MSESVKKNISFEMSEVESARFIEFVQKHAKCHEGSFGDKLIVSFAPTRMGDLVRVCCMCCGENEDITEMEKF